MCCLGFMNKWNVVSLYLITAAQLGAQPLHLKFLTVTERRADRFMLATLSEGLIFTVSTP